PYKRWLPLSGFKETIYWEYVAGVCDNSPRRIMHLLYNTPSILAHPPIPLILVQSIRWTGLTSHISHLKSNPYRLLSFLIFLLVVIGLANCLASYCLSRYLMISPAMSFPVACSIPSRPGEEFTSKINGPRAEGSISTPATVNPMARAAAIAVSLSVRVNLTTSAVPPRCKFERNSPSFAVLFMAPTTLPSTTKARMSVPLASLMYSWIKILFPRP